MKTISVGELRRNPTRMLKDVAVDRVTTTGEVIVTERGVPRWQVSVFHHHDAPLARLERDGRYTPPATTPTPWPSHPGGPAYTDAGVESLLDELRGDH